MSRYLAVVAVAPRCIVLCLMSLSLNFTLARGFFDCLEFIKQAFLVGVESLERFRTPQGAFLLLIDYFNGIARRLINRLFQRLFISLRHYRTGN